MELQPIPDFCANWPGSQCMSNVGGMLLLTKNTSILRRNWSLERKVGEEEMGVQCFFLANFGDPPSLLKTF